FGQAGADRDPGVPLRQDDRGPADPRCRGPGHGAAAILASPRADSQGGRRSETTDVGRAQPDQTPMRETESMIGPSTVPAWIRHRARPAALILLIGVAGCAGGGGAGGFRPPPIPVETASVIQEPVVDRFEAVGTIEAADAITAVSEIDGLVVDLPFREGSTVERGGIIAQLDDAELRAEVERTEALRDQALNTYNRVEAVVNQGAGA